MSCESRPPEPRSCKKWNFLKPRKQSEETIHVIQYIQSYALNNRGQDEVRKDLNQHTGFEWDRALTVCKKKSV